MAKDLATRFRWAAAAASTTPKAQVSFLAIDRERDFGYAGMEELARQLACIVESPIWPAVRRPAPWATPPGT